MRSLFIVDFPPESSLPPMEDGGLQLHYANGQLRGGYSCVGHVPSGPTALVVVEASEATIAAMKTDERYLWVEDL